MSTATAGRGAPYWYEWFVGLREVIGLIDEGSEITSVAFQLEGVKGWDDVVVKLTDDSRRCYQVKHTLDAASYAPDTDLDNIRDSVVGILFGLVVTAFVFNYVWPERAANRIKNQSSDKLLYS